MFQLHYLGHQVIENAPFLIDRPEGSYRYIFFHFLSSVQVLDKTGIVEVAPGSCILYTPGYPQKIISEHARLNHDYLDFTVSDATIFKEIHFPLNTVFKPWMSTEITDTIKKIYDEHNNLIIGCEYLISAMITNLFVQISRKIHNYSTSKLKYQEQLKDRFEKLRLEIYENPQQFSVKIMADNMNFSRSHFNALYKKYFYRTPSEDLNKARIEKVKILLQLNKTMEVIAKDVGFASTEYFFRWFKKHFNCTPSEYKKYWREGDA